jgi:hypothetical protein
MITQKPVRYIVQTQRRDCSWATSIHAPIHETFAAAQALADELTANESPLNPSRVVEYDRAEHVTFMDTDTLLRHCAR